MPKKLSTNTKAVESRERKAAIKKTKNDEEEKKKEDGKENWENFKFKFNFHID